MRRWWQWLLPALLVLWVGGCSSSTTQTGVFQRLSPEQAYQLLQQRQSDPNFIILDVRTPQEFMAGHIPGARNLDFYAPDFQTRLAQLPKDKVYFIYCNSGNRSGQTLTLMRRLGFQEVYELRGGIQAWFRGGYPIVADQ